MNFQELNPLVIPGDIMLVCGTDIGSKAIQLVTKSPWDHILAIFEKNGQRTCISSAFGQGVATIAFDQKLVDSHKETIILRPQWRYPNQPQVFLDFLLSKMGASYDYLGALSFGVRYLFPSFEFQVKHQYFCSEFIAQGLDQTHFFWTDKKPSLVLPKDFAESPLFKTIGRIEKA